MIVAAGLLVTGMGSLALVILELRKAPQGYEDERGFHAIAVPRIASSSAFNVWSAGSINPAPSVEVYESVCEICASRNAATATDVSQIATETDLVLFPWVGSQMQVAEQLRPPRVALLDR